MSKAICRSLCLNNSMLLLEKKIALEEIDLSDHEALDIMMRLADEIGFRVFGWKMFPFLSQGTLRRLFPFITMMQSTMTHTPENPTSPIRFLHDVHLGMHGWRVCAGNDGSGTKQLHFIKEYLFLSTLCLHNCHVAIFKNASIIRQWQ